MRQSLRRVSRLLEAAGRRGQQDYVMQVQAAEHGVLRALASAFGERPPPLVLGMEEGEEEDIRKQIVLKIFEANQQVNGRKD